MLRPGDTFDKYVVEGLLASGGMGEVYVVRHKRTNKRGALKIILPHLCTDPSMVERFLQEARIGARIEDAEHIVEVLDAGQDDAGSPWLVMEYLSGRDLGHVLDKVGTLSREAIVEILRQTAEALDNAHAKGVVHRDIKPENLFLVSRPGRPNTVKVLDFGIAKILEGKTQTGTSAGGTITYMAPEQGEGKAVGPRADVWPLGLIAYRALVGRPYWMGDSAFAVMKELVADELATASERAREQGAEVSLDDAFDDFFGRCVHRDPEARFATAGGAVSALAAALGVTDRAPLSIPEAAPPSDPLEASQATSAADATPAPPSSASGPTSRRDGTDLEVEVRVAEIKYAEQRRKQLLLVAKLGVVPVLVIAAVIFGLWYDRRATDQKRRDAWATFLACSTGGSPGSANVRELRRQVDLQKTVDRVSAAGISGDLTKHEEWKSDLLPCAPYARLVADLVERDEAKRVSFGRQMDQLSRPAGLAPEFVTDALETAYESAAELDVGGGTVDPSVALPKRAIAPVDAGDAGTKIVPACATDSVGTTMHRSGGVRRRTFHTPKSLVVCDFEKGGVQCGSFKTGAVAPGSVVSTSPLGDELLVNTGRGQALLPRVDASGDPIEFPNVWIGTDAPRGVRLVEGKATDGKLTILARAAGAKSVERTIDTTPWDDARVFVVGDKTVLLGRTLADPKEEDTSKLARPTHVLELARGQEPRALGDLEGYNTLYASCRARDATYLYVFDTSNEFRGGLVTWLGDGPGTLRTLPIGGYLDVSCDDEAITFSGRIRCPREGACVETPSSVKTDGWGGCTDGANDYSIVGADDAWLLWKGPAGGKASVSLLMDVADVVVEPPSFACGTGFAYALVRTKAKTRVIDLTTDPPRML